MTLTREEIREALPKITQTIEIESFVDSGSIPAAYFSKPYHVSPSGNGQKPYALLRDTLHKTGKVGLAKVVISTKQHFAALMPQGRGLVLNLLRWSEEVRTMEGLALPSEDVKVSPRELDMAEMLVNDLAGEWSPDLFHDEFKEQLAELIDKKAKSGKSITLAGFPESATPRVEGGERLMERIRGGWDAFQLYLDADTPPPLSEADTVIRKNSEWTQAAAAYTTAKQAADTAAEALELAKASLVALAVHPREQGAGVAVTRFLKAGNVDYRKVPALKGVDLDAYRGKSREEVRVTSTT